MSRLACFALLLAAVLTPCSRLFAEPLLVCGGDEVFLFNAQDAEQATIEKLWSWRAKDHPELPKSLRNRFGTTDDCKPIDGGHKILISSSGGACALVERSSGRVLWAAGATNAHSLELLPRERVVVACSVGNGGNRLVVFDLARGESSVCETPLESAHGVVWDEHRQRLWALGIGELQCYRLDQWESGTPALVLDDSDALPDRDGHDLQPIAESKDLVVSTGRHVYLFDRDARKFRLHPALGDEAHVKSISVHPSNGRVAVIRASDKEWWSDAVRFLSPAGSQALRGERVYKARWLGR